MVCQTESSAKLTPEWNPSFQELLEPPEESFKKQLYETPKSPSPKPNIIFLDFDGVVCNPETCLAVGDTGGCYSYIDPMSCGLIKKLCVDLNCKIVVSSSWRKIYDKFAIQAILNAACPQLGNYMYMNDRWCTETLGTNRGTEIKAWLDKYSTEFDNFVILDDNSDMEPLLSNFVKTDVYSGFRMKHFILARNILKGEQL